MNPNIVTTLAGILMTPVLALSSAVSDAVMAAPISTAMPTNFGCISLSHNLMYGSRDYQTNGDVSTLQGFLVTQGDLYVNPTGYFGPMTLHAVQRFQSSQGIFTTGYVGAFTRAAISRASCGGTPPPSQALYIQSLSPSITTVGSSVTIYGGGFTQDNTITLGTGAIVHVASYDGTTLTFTVPSTLSPACYFSTPPSLIASRQTTPGVYDLTVTN